MTADPTSTDPQARWHGTPGGYTNHSCRCQACTAAHTAYRRPNKNKTELESLRKQLREAREEVGRTETSWMHAAAERDAAIERAESAELDAENLGRKLGEAEAEGERLRAAYRACVEIAQRSSDPFAIREAQAALQPTPKAAGSPQADPAFAPCPRCGTPMNFHQDECEPQADTGLA